MAIVDAALRGWSTEDIEFVEVNDLEGARNCAVGKQSGCLFLGKVHDESVTWNRGSFVESECGKRRGRLLSSAFMMNALNNIAELVRRILECR